MLVLTCNESQNSKKSTSNSLELQGSAGKPLQISSGLPEGLQLAELESQMKISPLNRSSIFKCKKKNVC